MEPENRRKTQMNAIQRNYQFIKSASFLETSIAALRARKHLVAKNFDDFIDEHKELLQRVPKARFDEYDEVRAQMEVMYIDIIAAIDERIESQQDVIRRSAPGNSSNTATNEVNVQENSTESSKIPHSTRDLKEGLGRAKTKAAKKEFTTTTRQERSSQSDHDELIINEPAQLNSDESESESEDRKATRMKSTVVRARERSEDNRFEQILARFKENTRALQERAEEVYRYRSEFDRYASYPVSVPRSDERESYQSQRNMHVNSAQSYRQQRRSVPYEVPSIKSRLGPPPREDWSKTCNNCKGPHIMRRCPSFLSRSINNRRRRVDKLGLCWNCFIPIHHLREPHRCLAGPCRCGEMHNTLLCYDSVL